MDDYFLTERRLHLDRVDPYDRPSLEITRDESFTDSFLVSELHELWEKQREPFSPPYCSTLE